MQLCLKGYFLFLRCPYVSDWFPGFAAKRAGQSSRVEESVPFQQLLNWTHTKRVGQSSSIGVSEPYWQPIDRISANGDCKSFLLFRRLCSDSYQYYHCHKQVSRWKSPTKMHSRSSIFKMFSRSLVMLVLHSTLYLSL